MLMRKTKQVYLLKKMIQDAVGSMGRDKRCKPKDLGLEPSGYLGAAKNSITCVKSCLKQFMEFANGENKSVLTPEVISGWLLANADNWSEAGPQVPGLFFM